MKTKLTLSVDRKIMEQAKLKAAKKGMSLSKMFEEVFSQENPVLEKTPEQLAAARFLERLKSEPKIKALEKSDKEFIKEHWEEKYG